MKVLLVAEGASELAGALEALIRRLGLADAEFVHDRVSNPDIHAHHGKGQGYFKRCVRWMLEARKRGFDALILLIDQDRKPERRKELDNAQESSNCPIPRAIGVAIETFDAWMLADEQALCAICGRTVNRQPNPEATKDPKGVINLILADILDSDPFARICERLAHQIDLALLEERCPGGFAVFARRVRALAQ